MRKGNFKFAFYVLLATVATIVTAYFIGQYKNKFAFEDFGNISSIIQGTFGVAVSLAGAFVAIRLAQLSTLIIEKEKKREDSKFFHQIISDAISPIKGLTSRLQDFGSLIYPHRAIFMIKEADLDWADRQKLDEGLTSLKADIIKGFEGMIHGLKGLAENQYSYAFWLYITEERRKEDTLLTRGGGGRQSYRTIFSGDANEKNFLIEDLNVLCEICRIALDRFSKCDLTIEDIQTASEIWQKGGEKYRDGPSLTYNESFLVTLTLLSCYQTRFHSVTPIKPGLGYFENRLVLVFFDIYYNIPQKKQLTGFATSLFPDDDLDIIQNSPITQTFELLNDSYWLSFFTISGLAQFQISELKNNRDGEIFGTDEVVKIWEGWQAKKNGLYNPYFDFDDNFIKINRRP